MLNPNFKEAIRSELEKTAKTLQSTKTVILITVAICWFIAFLVINNTEVSEKIKHLSFISGFFILLGTNFLIKWIIAFCIQQEKKISVISLQ